ncbi:hypothetical protein [Psittacicella hinzii]
MKRAFDRSSYTKIYIYAGIIVLCVVLYLFVFRDTSNKDSILLSKNETATVQINSPQETTEETLQEETLPAETEAENDAQPETPVAAPVAQPQEAKKAAQNDTATTNQTATTTADNNLIPLVPENAPYTNLQTTLYQVKKGQTAGTIFAREKGVIFQMANVNKAIERLGENDKIYIKRDSSGQIVVLAIDRARGGFIGQYVLVDKKFVFVSKR